MLLMAEPGTSIPPLLQKAQQGDRAALGQLFEECRPRLDALLRDLMGVRLRRESGVEDVLQEVFARACGSIDRFEWRDEDSLLRWLSVIGRNVVLEAARREKAAPEPLAGLDPGGHDVSLSRGLRRQERFDRLQEAIQRLDPDHRQVILLARIEKLPLKDVAARMGRSHAAVRQLLRRALQKLKEDFGDTESLGLPPRRLGEREENGR
jgi:RNA polymerase sigma-70 factor (ECF subfamily)